MPNTKNKSLPSIANSWFRLKKWKAFAFQKDTWKAIAEGKSGLLNSPTGSGKTYAIWFGVLQAYYKKNPLKKKIKQEGLHCLWITPLRALSKEILLSTQRVSKDLDLHYKIALRTGDTSSAERARQRKKVATRSYYYSREHSLNFSLERLR